MELSGNQQLKNKEDDAIRLCYYIMLLRRITSFADFRIVAGEHSLSVDSGLEQIRQVSAILPHPGFDDITYEDDISLIFVS